MTREKMTAQKALSSKSAKKQLKKARLERFHSEAFSDTVITVSSTSSSNSRETEGKKTTADEGIPPAPSSVSTKPLSPTDQRAPILTTSAANRYEDDAELVDYDEASEDENHSSPSPRSGRSFTAEVVEDPPQLVGEEIPSQAQSLTSGTPTIAATSSALDHATSTRRSQQQQRVSTSSQQFPSGVEQDNVAEHLDLQEEDSERFPSSDPLADQDAAARKARKRTATALLPLDGAIRQYARDAETARKRKGEEPAPIVESFESEQDWYFKRHAILSVRTSVNADQFHEEYADACKVSPRSDIILAYWERPRRHSVQVPPGARQYTSRAIGPAEMKDLTNMEAALLQFARETNQFLPSEYHTRYYTIEIIVERRRLAALDKTLLEHPDAYGRYPLTMMQYQRFSASVRRGGASPSVLDEYPMALEIAPLDPNSRRFDPTVQLRQRQVYADAQAGPLPISDTAMRASVKQSRRYQQEAEEYFRESEQRRATPASNASSSANPSPGEASSSLRGYQIPRRQQPAEEENPYDPIDFFESPATINTGSSSRPSTQLSGQQSTRSNTAAGQQRTLTTRPILSQTGQQQAQTLRPPASQPEQRSLQPLDLVRETSLRPPPPEVRPSQLVLLPNDPIEAFTLDVDALGGGIQLTDIQKLERSYSEAKAKHRGESWIFRNHMTQATIDEVNAFFRAYDVEVSADWADETQPTVGVVFDYLRRIFAGTQSRDKWDTFNPSLPLWQRIAKVPLEIHYGSFFDSISLYTRRLRQVAGSEAQLTGQAADIRAAFAKHEQLHDLRVSSFVAEVFNGCQPDSVYELCERLRRMVRSVIDASGLCERLRVFEETRFASFTTERKPGAPQVDTRKQFPKALPPSNASTPSVGTSIQGETAKSKQAAHTPRLSECSRCNRYLGRKETQPHTWDNCPWREHPLANHERGVPWAESTNGKRWAKVGVSFLPIEHTLDAAGNKISLPYKLRPLYPTEQGQPVAASAKPASNRKKTCKSNTTSSTITNYSTPHESVLQTRELLPNINTTIAHSDYVMGYLCSLETDITAPVTVYFDTGAFHGNYISRRVARWLVSNFHVKINPCDATICGANASWCVKCIGKLSFMLNLNTETSSTMLALSLDATILDGSFDIVLGRPSIKEHNLALFFPSHFVNLDERTKAVLAKMACVCGDNRCYPTDPTAPDQRAVDQITPRDVIKPASVQTAHSLLTLVKEKEELLSPTPDDAEAFIKEPGDIAEVLPSEHSTGVDELDYVRLEGSPELRKRIRALCEEYRHIFSTSLRETSADVPPMELHVDTLQWHAPRNRRPYRVQSRDKEESIRKLVQQLLDLGLIRPSKATAWSQVLLVPKPTPGEWRLCIDYRALNEVSKGEHWPLPVINQVIQRLGRLKPKFYGKMDFTSGFWQTPLAEDSKPYTAFITFMGLYEFNVVAMGLKGAPSYFQSAMASYVLAGLLYIVCELYIDDVIVHGDTEESFLANLEQVFQRFSDRKILLHPKKCAFGMGETEFVGHIIDGEGKRMSPEKIRKVLDRARPYTVKELRSFLGLVNYFRDHISRHADISYPLYQLLKSSCGTDNLKSKKGQTSKRKLDWTQSAVESYEEVIDAVAKCPKLYFLEEDERTHPIFLMTDASAYGYGAYLCQRINGVDERPIAFSSKTFSSSQLRWSANEKEAFGVYHGIVHFEYLLRDKRFTLRTDHKNLTYISESCSAKIIRWKLAIMEFNFDCEHISGKDNIVADYFSRVKPDTNEETVLLHYQAYELPRQRQEMIEYCHAMVWAPTLELGRLALRENAEKTVPATPNGPTPMVLPDPTLTMHSILVDPTIENPTSGTKQKRRQKRVRLEPQADTAIMPSHTPQPLTDQTPKEPVNQPTGGIGNTDTNTPEVAVVVQGQAETRKIEDLYQAFRQVHGALPGHHGVERTLQKLIAYLRAKGESNWPGMRADVKRFVQQCPCCQKMSHIKPIIAAKPFTLASYSPWDKVNIDAMGPFPETAEGYQHILVVIDCFTRFVELFPIKTTSAAEAKRAILALIGRYGIPNSITTDGGSQFKNRTIQELIDSLGIEHNITMSYSKEENAMVERANKEVLRHLAAMVYETRINDEWIEFLPLIQRIINSTPHQNTGVAPAQLLFGNAVQLDRGVFLPIHKVEGKEPSESELASWIDNMLSKQRELMVLAEKLQREQDEANLKRRDKQNYTEFPINSYVLVAYPHTRMGQRPPVKTMTHYRGPMRVVHFTDSKYTVQDLVTLKEEKVHVSLLKKFEYDPDLVDPAEVARHDTQEFLVEQILAHRGNFERKSGLEFKVRWQGYGPEHDTWEPWSELRNNTALHDYLRSKNLARHIPR